MLLAHPSQLPLQDLNEEISIENLPFRGKIPMWIEGTLIRNGPAKFHFGTQTISHWFDGLAMLHAFSFGQNKVSYRNKFLRSDAYFHAIENKDLRFMGFAQDPCKSVFKRLFSYFLPSLTHTIVQNANVNVMRIAQNYVALTETPLPVCFDPKTLETLGVLDFADSLIKKNCFESVHPHHDRKTLQTINYQIEMGAKCHYIFYTIPDVGPVERKPFFKMKSDKASYMHTFALTEHFVVLVEFPLVLNPIDILLKRGGYISQFKWEPERNTRFHVIDRSQSAIIRSYETEPFFCFHHVNAYEEKNTIVVDLIRYPNPEIVFGDPSPGQIRKFERFRLDLTKPSISQNTIAETLLELPRIYYQKYNASFYQHAYGVGFKYPTHPEDSIPLIKIDVSNGSTIEWSESGAWAGEPVFVPSPNGKGEDEGVLLSLVLDALNRSSFLLILDAKNLHEIARSDSIHLIPYGLHGMFFHNSFKNKLS